MNKKGFTLIELLAVVVILATLVTIAIVSINNSINQSRESLSSIQIKNIEEAAEVYYLKEGMDTMEYPLPCVDLDYLIDNDYLNSNEVKNPNSNENIEGSVKILYENNKYKYKYQEKTCEVYNQVCRAVTENTKTVGNVPEGNYNAGDEYICEVKEDTKYHFFVLSVEGDNVNLILDRNINSDGTLVTELIQKSNPKNGIYNTVEWISDDHFLEMGGNQTDLDGNMNLNIYGPITAMNYLDEATKDWTNLNLTTINKFTDDAGNIYNMKKTYNSYARLPYYSEILDANGSNNYLYENLDGLEWHGSGPQPTNNITGIDGYWTLSSYMQGSNYHVWFACRDGLMTHVEVYQPNSFGIRPVISVPKSNFVN